MGGDFVRGEEIEREGGRRGVKAKGCDGENKKRVSSAAAPNRAITAEPQGYHRHPIKIMISLPRATPFLPSLPTRGTSRLG